MQHDKLLLLFGLVVGTNSMPTWRILEEGPSLHQSQSKQKDPTVKAIRLFGVNIQASYPIESSSTGPVLTPSKGGSGASPSRKVPDHTHHEKGIQRDQEKTPEGSRRAEYWNTEQQAYHLSPDQEALMRKLFTGGSRHIQDLDPKFKYEGKDAQEKKRVSARRTQAKKDLIGHFNDSKEKLEEVLVRFGAEAWEGKPKTDRQLKYIRLKERKRKLGVFLGDPLSSDHQSKKGRPRLNLQEKSQIFQS